MATTARPPEQNHTEMRLGFRRTVEVIDAIANWTGRATAWLIIPMTLAVTWEVVAKLNADHAREYANVTQAEALQRLRNHSREAADGVRAFSEAELDQAAPFALSYGAPVTAQFVIEDHTVRHSWHHLARIRRALSR